MLKQGEERAAVGVKNKLIYLAENRLKKLIIETQCTAKANTFVKKRLRLIQKQLVHYEVGMETERTC